jgi:hypothetical protein
MKTDIDPGLKGSEDPPKTFNDGMGMVFDLVPLLEGQEADALIIIGGQRFSLENGRSEVSPDIP